MISTMTKKILGLVEQIKIKGNGSSKIVIGRIDTGATKSSIDSKLASELKAGPIIKTIVIKSAHGHALRPIIRIPIVLEGETVTGSFTIADRSHMKYKVLIGQDILKKGNFLIDPLKK